MDTSRKEVKDWQGRTVLKEKPSDVVLAWEVTPHPQTSRYDCMVVRGWQDMLSCTADHLEYFLERYSEEELKEGVTLTFKLAEWRVEDLPDGEV